MKILTCVPPQFWNFDEKLGWMSETYEQYKPDLFVAPQEFMGGFVGDPKVPYYKKKEWVPVLEKWCKERKGVGLSIGAVDDTDGHYSEQLWLFDEGKFLGSQKKFALPRYSIKSAKGSYQTEDEVDFNPRWKTFPIKGKRVAVSFCWEAFGMTYWHGLAKTNPDMILSQIKFGQAAYPGYEVREHNGQKLQFAVLDKFQLMGFKTVEEDPWYQCYELISEYICKCPIFLSTNSWGLGGKSTPLAGCVWPGHPQHDIYTFPREEKQTADKQLVVVTDL